MFDPMSPLSARPHDSAASPAPVMPASAGLPAARGRVTALANGCVDAVLGMAARGHALMQLRDLKAAPAAPVIADDLASTYEELDNLNARLMALTGELKHTIERQRITADDLQNILCSTDVPTLFLGQDGTVRLFTPATQMLFDLTPDDIGRPFFDLALRSHDPMLAEDIALLLIGEPAPAREITTPDNSCFRRRILAYHTHGLQVEGVIVTYTDITEHRQAALALHQARALAEAAGRDAAHRLTETHNELLAPLRSLARLQARLAGHCTDAESEFLVQCLEQELDRMARMLDAMTASIRPQADAAPAGQKAAGCPAGQLRR